MTAPTIGFVGLGNMGGAMVHALLDAGHAPVVHDLDRAALDAAVSEGAVAAASLAELAARTDVVGVCVANDAQVRSVLEEGLLDGLRDGAVVVLHSTLLPETVRWAAEQATTHGVGLVEAPVTGGPAAAVEGRLTVLLSGDDDHVAAIEPLLDACSRLRIPAGPFGNANLLKLCINLQNYVTHVAVAEAASLARALDLPLEGLKAAMEANGQLGELTRNYFVLHELPDETLDDPRTVAMRGPLVAIIAKDIDLMKTVAAGIGHDVPAIHLAGEQVVDTYRMPDRSR